MTLNDNNNDGNDSIKQDKISTIAQIIENLQNQIDLVDQKFDPVIKLNRSCMQLLLKVIVANNLKVEVDNEPANPDAS